MKVLYLDKEGGFGGSSRSLYHLLRYLDRSRFEPIVVAREPGPAQRVYRDLSIDSEVVPIPLYKPCRRKNLLVLAMFLARLPKWVRTMRQLSRIIATENVGLLHVNHDGFFPVAFWNRLFWKKPLVFHVRTMLPANRFGRWQARAMVAFADKLICISPMERDRLLDLCPGAIQADKLEIVFNIAEPYEPDSSSQGGATWGDDGKFHVIWLGNLSRAKGTDRVLEIARVLKLRGRDDIVFYVVGAERNPRRGRSRLTDELEAVIGREQLGDLVRLIGFVSEPEPLIAASQVLLRTSRSNDPWGRDILEGLVHGKPVLATGERSPFMEHGRHGYLFPDFDASQVADALVLLADQPQLYRELSDRSRAHGRKHFSGASIGARIESIYREVSCG